MFFNSASTELACCLQFLADTGAPPPVPERRPLSLQYRYILAVADPGFSQGGANPRRGGGAGIKFNFFLRKLHEIEKKLAARGGAPLDPRLIRSSANRIP